MAKRTSSKKEISLFDTTTTQEPTAQEQTQEPTAQEPTVEPTEQEPTQEPTHIGMWLRLKSLLACTDEAAVAESEGDVCASTKSLLGYVKETFTESVETLSASMATGSEMTQDMAVETIMSLVGEKAGYDKLEAQLFICEYTPLLVQVNEYMRSGFQCYLAIAKACYETNVQYLPASVRTLFNACIVYQKKDDAGLMQWVFWSPKCKTRNAVATHSIAQGCFIRSNGLEHLFTPSMPHVDVETRETPNTRGEIVQKPVIDYQWEAKSQRVLAFWKAVGIDEGLWEKSLAHYDGDAREHVVSYKASCEEKFAKANTKGALKGLETTKKAPNAVKVRNAKLKQLFADMDF